MNRLRKLTLTGAALGVAAMLTAHVPSALSQDGAPAGRKGPGRMGRMHHGMTEAPLITIALKHKTELNLNTEQTTNLEKIKTHYQTQVVPLQQQLAGLEKEVFTLSQQSPANLIQIKAKIQEGEKYRSELRYLRIEALENGKSILTPAQQEQLKTLARSRFEHFRRDKSTQAS
jgi:Spy/CpxP family protein refolding chaperone